VGPDDVVAAVTWPGHSTVLVELPGFSFLTDPVFRSRLGPLRRHGAAPDPAALPEPDAVLVSHAHPDHFSRSSIRRVPGDPLVIVPPGLGSKTARARPGVRVHELEVGAFVELGGWRVTAVPARHWRWPFAPDVPAIGYLVEGAANVYFAGDTSPFAGMSALHGRVDLALLPIGRWGPQPTPGHLTPRSAARVAATIGAAVVVPVHWGTFYPVGLDRVHARPLREPAIRFVEEAARLAPAVEVRPIEPGGSTEIQLARRSGAAGLSRS
jgi:L-ascorbate metabolism protein UlaG (beta-lactamase superfamily)